MISSVILITWTTAVYWNQLVTGEHAECETDNPIFNVKWVEITNKDYQTNRPVNSYTALDETEQFYHICQASDGYLTAPGRVNGTTGECIAGADNKRFANSRYKILTVDQPQHLQYGPVHVFSPGAAVTGGCSEERHKVFICKCSFGNKIGRYIIYKDTVPPYCEVLHGPGFRRTTACKEAVVLFGQRFH